MATRTVTLAAEIDWPGFRHGARALLAALVPPEDVYWDTHGLAGADLFARPVRLATPVHFSRNAFNFVVPPGFIALCETVILHIDPSRFALLYRLLWRLVHEPALRHNPLDTDRVQAQHMAQAVRHDMHRMKAFVRFRPVGHECEAPTYVAWFEPDHHIVEAVAPFFARRFAQMRWAILTPARSVRWDGRGLEFGPGAERRDAPPADADEALWLAYYLNIFDPARLTLTMMRKEMPRKYWHNLPQAELLRSLPDDPVAALVVLSKATDRCR